MRENTKNIARLHQTRMDLEAAKTAAKQIVALVRVTRKAIRCSRNPKHASDYGSRD